MTYPNLELMEYKFEHYLINNRGWMKKIVELKTESGNKYFSPEFDIFVFPQFWGSTTTAFDVCEDGSPAMGGQAITKAYTVVIREDRTETYGVLLMTSFATW